MNCEIFSSTQLVPESEGNLAAKHREGPAMAAASRSNIPDIPPVVSANANANAEYEPLLHPTVKPKDVTPKMWA